MAIKTIAIAIALILLGLIGYFASGAVSVTALIPALFGIVLLVLGFLARDDKKRAVAMHIAVVVGLLGFLGSVSGVFKLPALLSGAPVDLPAAVIAKSIMAGLTGIFVALCVRAFILARRQRTG